MELVLGKVLALVPDLGQERVELGEDYSLEPGVDTVLATVVEDLVSGLDLERIVAEGWATVLEQVVAVGQDSEVAPVLALVQVAGA